MKVLYYRAKAARDASGLYGATITVPGPFPKPL